jgi:26S proteasome regulatory subunit N11
MLLNLHKKKWTDGLTLENYNTHQKTNEKLVQEMQDLAKQYNKAIQDEEKMTKEKLEVHKVGKLDPKRHLQQDVEELMTANIVQSLGAVLDTVLF